MTHADAAPFRLIAVLVVATAIGPFAMQIYLPALPAIQAGFGVSAGTAQLAFSLSAFSIAISTLFYGPISDRVGRRPALIGGLIVFLAGSAMCAIAPTITILIVGRIVQAAGGSAGLVLTRAIVRDRFGLERSASLLAYITLAMVAAPMLAPALGGLLADVAGWRAIFGLGLVLGHLGGRSAAEARCTGSFRCCAHPRSWVTRSTVRGRSRCSSPFSPRPRS